MLNKILVYLSMFFLFFDSFPFEKIGLGSSKPLSLVFLAIYFALNIRRIINTKCNRIEKGIMIFFIIMLINSLFKGWIVYSNLNNFKRFFNENISIIFIYFALKDIFINYKFKLDKIINSIFYGYCFNNIFGILQLIYFKTGSEFLLRINDFFMRTTHHIENGRLHFLFGEPSFIGTHIVIIIIPLIVLCKYKSIKINMFIRINFLIMIILSFNSKSLRFILDIIIGLIIILLVINREKIMKVVFVVIPLIIMVLIFTPKILNSFSDNLLVMRINNIINKSSNVTDNSLWARKDYSLVGLNSLKKNPILGYGGGYYDKAYKENIAEVDPYYYNNMELLRNYDAEYLNSINMYARFSSEFGLIGIIFLVIFIINIFRKKKNNILKAIFILILYNWVQNDSLILITNMFWITYIINNNEFMKVGEI